MSDNLDKIKTKYKNITVSGLPGAGSTTLGKHLAQHLGFKYFSGGDWMRSYAISNNLFDANETVHHDQSIIQDEIDRQMDHGMREKMVSGSGCVYESWLSGFLAQQVEGTFKVLIYCSDDSVRVDRIANRDDITIVKAKDHIFAREEKNLKKWVKMYQDEWNEWVVKPKTLGRSEPIYFWRTELYDLAIDTYRLGKEETIEKVLQAIAQN